MTTTKKTPAAAKTPTYTIEDLKARQKREGFSFGYLGHSVRSSANAAKADAVVLKFLTRNGFDKDDAYQALNSRNARHMGDALDGIAAATQDALEKIIGRNIGWTTPAAMYADLGETKEQLAEKIMAPAKEKNVVVEVTLKQDENGMRTFHISRLGQPGLGSDEYHIVDNKAMGRDLGAELVKLLGAR